MSRRKNILLASACIILGMALAGPAAQAAGAFLKAYPSTHTMYLDGQQVELEAYTINGSNYVRLRDVGEAVGFNVYWDSAAGAVQIDSDTPYTGQPPAAETAASTDLDTVRQDIAALVNQAWREHGLPELAIDQRLMTAAQVCADRRYTWHHTGGMRGGGSRRVSLRLRFQPDRVHRLRGLRHRAAGGGQLGELPRAPPDHAGRQGGQPGRGGGGTQRRHLLLPVRGKARYDKPIQMTAGTPARPLLPNRRGRFSADRKEMVHEADKHPRAPLR